MLVMVMETTPWLCTSSNYIHPQGTLLPGVSASGLRLVPPGSWLHSLLLCCGHGEACGASHGPPKGCLGIGFEQLQSKVSVVVIWYNPAVIHFWVALAICVIDDFIKKYCTIFWFIIYNLIAMCLSFWLPYPCYVYKI